MMVQRLLAGFAMVSTHRGGRLSTLSAALARALSQTAPGDVSPEVPEGADGTTTQCEEEDLAEAAGSEMQRAMKEDEEKAAEVAGSEEPLLTVEGESAPAALGQPPAPSTGSEEEAADIAAIAVPASDDEEQAPAKTRANRKNASHRKKGRWRCTRCAEQCKVYEGWCGMCGLKRSLPEIPEDKEAVDGIADGAVSSDSLGPSAKATEVPRGAT